MSLPVVVLPSEWTSVVVLVTLLSFVVDLVGAVQGAMCCPDGGNALRNQLTSLVHRDFHSFPLAPWLLVPLAICTALFVVTLARRRDRLSYFTR